MKKLFKNKTTAAGIGAVVIGIGTILSGNTTDGVQMIMGGLIGVFLRDAIQKNGTEPTK